MPPTNVETLLAPWSGCILERRYRLDRVVGRGGFGTVFEGRHLTLDVPIAVKVLHLTPESIGPERHAEALASFTEEARIIARLRHPNIVSVLDSGITSAAELTRAEGDTADAGGALADVPVPWFVLEWCDGTALDVDLDDRRGAGGRSVEETWRLLRPIVEAVAYGHEQGIVHRDIKPSNVMLVPGARERILPRLLDFGIAKHMEAEELPGSGLTMTQSTRRSFTPAYAATEQFIGGRTGPWTDVYALALLFVEVLTDAMPYGTESPALGAVDGDRPTPARHGVDAGAWEPVLLRALAVRPSDRFADAGELLAALEAAFPAAARAPRAAAVRGPETVVVPGPAEARSVAWSAETLAAPMDTPIDAPPPPRTSRTRVVALAAAGALALGLVAMLLIGARSSAPSGAPSAAATATARAAEPAAPPPSLPGTVTIVPAPRDPPSDAPLPISGATAVTATTAAPTRTPTAAAGNTTSRAGSAPKLPTSTTRAQPAATLTPGPTASPPATSTAKPHLY